MPVPPRQCGMPHASNVVDLTCQTGAVKPLPRFWTTADGEARRADGRQLRLRMWGWSTASLADAAAVAADRLSQARAKAAAGQELQSWAYYPRTPLREETLGEVLSPDGTLLAVVTRNRYGAEILNTDLLLIADIDLPESSASRSSPASGGGVLGRLFGRRGAASPTPERSPDGASPEEVEALERVSHVGASRPDLGVRTYRTAAGLRVLVTGGDLPPGTPAAEEVLEELASDPAAGHRRSRRCLPSYRALAAGLTRGWETRGGVSGPARTAFATE